MKKKFISDDDQKLVVQSIQLAEKNTSGEIRVHLEDFCKGDPIERTKRLFKKLKMSTTKDRNGVLFYIAIKDRKFAIWGDVGINEVVPSNFWEDVKAQMTPLLKKGKTQQALCDGISMTGIKLKEFFPYQKDDTNELSDEISVS